MEQHLGVLDEVSGLLAECRALVVTATGSPPAGAASPPAGAASPAPFSALQITAGLPRRDRIFISLPRAKKARNRPSGETESPQLGDPEIGVTVFTLPVAKLRNWMEDFPSALGSGMK